MQTLQIRQPYDHPAYPGRPSTTQPVRTIQIRHPGYNDPTNLLFQFDAYDGDCGIHYQTAHVVCAIIADNKWEGYFSTDVEGLHRAGLSTQDALLVDDTYYFHVPGENRYAVVPTFAEWLFPHGNLPAAWRCPPTTTTSFPAHLNADRDRCSLTRATLRVETAHIVPANSSDVKWWNDNGMLMYGEHSSTYNTIRFRVDVHQLFDRKPRFAIVPKNNTLVAHIFHATKDIAEAVRLYHNVPLQFLEETRMEFLLARLAWTVFPYLEVFLSSGKRRKLSRIGENGVRVVEELDGDKCYQIYTQSTTRSRSPRKRNIGQVNQTMQRDGDGEYDDESAIDNDSDSATDSDDEYQRRGRRRRRSSKIL